jgi:PKD repeat protein
MKRVSILFILTGLLAICTGCEEKEPVYVNQAPSASFAATPLEGDSPLNVYFDAGSSTDPEADMLSYLWDLGDGSSSTDVHLSHRYEEEGSFTVNLTVSDPEGLSDKDQAIIRVNEPPPPPNLFPLSKNAQWVYFVKSTATENGAVSEYEEGYTYLTVKELNLDSDGVDYMTLRITGKKYYTGPSLGDFIFLAHTAGKDLRVKHYMADEYRYMINVGQSSWSHFAMFFTPSLNQSVILSSATVAIDLGTFEAFHVYHNRENWDDNYASERYDITEEEFLNPNIGLLGRITSRYVNFRDCFTCPVYGGSSEIELVGYYIPQADGSVVEGGYGYNPENPYGGNEGILTLGATEDIGYTEVKIDGEDVGTISNYWPDGLTCDQPLALNVSRSDGSYTLTAESNLGYYWEGTITFVQGTCDTVELLLSKKGISASQVVRLAPRSSAGSTQ